MKISFFTFLRNGVKLGYPFIESINHFRDRTFIEPYVKSGSMSVYKYQNLEDELDDALAFTMNNINALFKAS